MDVETHPSPQTARRSRRTAVLARLDDATVAAAVRTGVSPRAVVGVIVVAVLVVGLLGARVAMARAGGRPQPIAPAPAPTVRLASASEVAASAAPTGAGSGAPSPSGTATGPAPAGALAAESIVVVHVVGQVRRPGVVRLAAGARVQDALAAAGGATRRADLAAVNLARLVVDGEQVVVPRPGAATPPAPGSAGPGGTGGTGAGAAGGAAAAVDLNTAGESELDALPGIGPVLAGRIVAFRQEHGHFSTVDELAEVSGIGDAVLERLRPLVRL